MLDKVSQVCFDPLQSAWWKSLIPISIKVPGLWGDFCEQRFAWST